MEDHKNCGDELGKDKSKATLKRGLQMKNYQIINFLIFYRLIVIWTCIPGRGKWLVWGWRTLTFVLLFVCLVILICLFSKQDQHQKALDEILQSLNTSTSTGSIIQTEPAGCQGEKLFNVLSNIRCFLVCRMDNNPKTRSIWQPPRLFLIKTLG